MGTTEQAVVLFHAASAARRDEVGAALASVRSWSVITVDDAGDLLRTRRGTDAGNDVGVDVVAVEPPRGVDTARWISDVHAAHPGAHLVALTTFADVQQFYDCLMAGAVGFCDPDRGARAVVRTVRAVLDDGVAVPRALVRPLVDGLRDGRGHAVDTPTGRVVLTRREWEVLLLVRQRRSTEEMASLLYVSKATVRSHVAHLLHKLDLRDRDDAVALLGRL